MLYNNIPQEMRNYVQWCCWKYEETDTGHPTKVPYNPKTSKLASVADPSTWCSFEEAVAGIGTGWFSGLGFIFTDRDPFAGIDLDAPKDSETKKITPDERRAIVARQEQVFQAFNSYSERSPSGKGLHIIVKGKVSVGRKRTHIEVYSQGRFFTMTGDVFHNAPVEHRQDILTATWEAMGKGTERVNGFVGSMVQALEDQEVIDRASRAENGDKFTQLLQGHWNGLYPSHSEADLALINIIAFYTQHRMQIARIFRASALGQRQKAQRGEYLEWMINKSFDRMLPDIDFDELINQVNEAIAAAHNPTASAIAAPAVMPVAPATGVSQVFANAPASPQRVFRFPDDVDPELWKREAPKGLMGAIQDYIFKSSPRPVYEISLVGAIGLMAGITGRAYNISGTGLNHYILALADTGTGKEALMAGINRLMSAVTRKVQSADDFIGPADMASGQAILKHLSDRSTPCYVSIVGEFGLKMAQLASKNANTAEVQLKRVILDLYNKSGAGDTVRPTIYSDKKNNTEVVNSPAMSIVGESVPEAFYQVLDEGMIASGLLPRFIIIEYAGVRVDLNEGHYLISPHDGLVSAMEGLVLSVHDAMQNARATMIGVHEKAAPLLRDLERFCTSKINASSADVLKQLWNRVHLKVLKLAGLLAVSENSFEPIITVDNVAWATSLVITDTNALTEKFNAGKIGVKNESSEQMNKMIGFIQQYVEGGFPVVKSYPGVKVELVNKKLIPRSYLVNRCQSTKCFEGSKNYIANAEQIIKSLISDGVLQRMTPTDKDTAGIKFAGEIYAPIGYDQIVKNSG